MKLYVAHHCVRGHDVRVKGRDRQGSCRACKDQTRIEYQARRRELLHQYKLETGCERCGYDTCAKALDLHHPDPALKELKIGMHFNYAFKRFWDEVAKCLVLCRNCHAEYHAGVWS